MNALMLDIFTIKQLAEVRYALERRMEYLYKVIKEIEKELVDDPNMEVPEYFASSKGYLIDAKSAFFKISGYEFIFTHCEL